MDDNTIVQYKTDNYYAPNREGVILWSDKEIGIKWPIESNSIIISDKDKNSYLLKDAQFFD